VPPIPPPSRSGSSSSVMHETNKSEPAMPDTSHLEVSPNVGHETAKPEPDAVPSTSAGSTPPPAPAPTNGPGYTGGGADDVHSVTPPVSEKTEEK
jgi:hypothetical protein